jgi:hypothetical protein
MPGTPLLQRFGGTVGAATVGSLLASGPGALRLSAAGELGALRAWMLLAGLLLLPMLAAVPLVRLARDGLRGYMPSDGSGTLERVGAAAVFACTWLWFLSAFGAVVRAQTHQRALAAVTFAVIAVASMLFLVLVARRLARILGAVRQRTSTVGGLLAVAAVALSVVLIGLRIAHAASALSVGARATLVDGLAIALALTLAARRSMLPRIGPPAAVCIFIVAMHTLASGNAALVLEQVCPLFFALLHLVAL